MADLGRIVVVGTSAAGLSALETFRQAGHTGPITMVGRETHLPYERPPVSKQILRGECGPEDLAVRTAAEIDRLMATWHLGRSAVRLDRDAQTVWLDDGSELTFDALVIATGLVARTLPLEHDPDVVVTVRTVDDGLRLATRLTSGSAVAVIGAGFLGTEVAASARECGSSVHLIDAEPLPLAPLGPTVGRVVADLHRSRGVELHLGVGVASLDGAPGGRTSVVLNDGTVVEVDTVVVAVGGRPETAWLDDSGLDLADGVTCDEHGRAATRVYAAGDVARWYVPSLGRHVRVEHRMNASAQGAYVAHAILGGDLPASAIPYFWTDQYGARIQVFGHLPGRFDPAIEPVLEAGSVEEGRFALAFRDGDESLLAGLAWNLPSAARAFRSELTPAQRPARA